MKLRTAVLLLIAAIIVGFGGWYLGRTPDTERVAAAQPAFPELGDKLANAAKIVILHDGATLELDRAGTGQGGNWTIAQRDFYPALPDKVHALFVSLAELRLVEPRTSNPDQLGRLGLEDADKTGATSTLVRVTDAQVKPVAAILLGDAFKPGEGAAQASAGSGTAQLYVRKPGETQSWLAEGQITANTDPSEWMTGDLSNISRDKITSVEVSHGDAKLSFARQDGKFALTAPADHPPLDQSKVDDVARGYEWLALTGVEKAADMKGDPLGASVFRTDDGLVLTATLVRNDKDIWAVFHAAGDGAAAAQAKTLSALFDGWAYKIGDWKVAALVPTLDDLKAKPPEKPAVPAPTATPEPAPAPEAAH